MRYIALAPIRFTNKEVKTGDTFIPKNEDVIRPLLDNGIARPVRDVLAEGYRELCKWLKSYPVTAEEIQQHSDQRYPGLLSEIHKTIDKMDTCFISENLQGFNENMERVKNLYLQAMTEVNQKELTKLTTQES